MIIIKNGTLVTSSGESKADILIKGNIIDEISQSIYYKSAKVYDATGCKIFAGFIDGHTHLGMEIDGVRTSDDFYSGTRAAIAGGTTTIIDFAMQKKGDCLKETIEDWKARTEGKSFCDYSCHVAISDWNDTVKSQLPALVEAGITSYKAFMANDKLMLPNETIRDMLIETKKHGARLLSHCENGEIVNELIKESIQNGNTEPCFHHLSRPDFTEATAIAKYCEIAKEANADACIVHLSSNLGLQEALAARDNGQNVYIETCPHYLTLDESVYSLPNFEGAKYVCSPPIRAKEDNKALWQGIAEGKINTVSTDHCSYNFKGQKELGIDDFTKIPNGICGIEHRASLIYTYGVLEDKITAEKMSAILSENIAKQFGLYPKKGALLVDSDADIVIWDCEQSFVVSADTMLTECDYTPYEGMELTGKPRAVFLKGELVYNNGELIGEPMGEFIKRKKVSE